MRDDCRIDAAYKSSCRFDDIISLAYRAAFCIYYRPASLAPKSAGAARQLSSLLIIVAASASMSFAAYFASRRNDDLPRRAQAHPIMPTFQEMPGIISSR